MMFFILTSSLLSHHVILLKPHTGIHIGQVNAIVFTLSVLTPLPELFFLPLHRSVRSCNSRIHLVEPFFNSCMALRSASTTARRSVYR